VPKINVTIPNPITVMAQVGISGIGLRVGGVKPNGKSRPGPGASTEIGEGEFSGGEGSIGGVRSSIGGVGKPSGGTLTVRRVGAVIVELICIAGWSM
jgi:hypothetical protein